MQQYVEEFDIDLIYRNERKFIEKYANKVRSFLTPFLRFKCRRAIKDTHLNRDDAEKLSQLVIAINQVTLRRYWIAIRQLAKDAVFRKQNRIKIPKQKPSYQDYLSIACIIKNEASYMKEWIEFHRLVGVQRFYIFDNGSTDGIKNILQPYIQEGIVRYFYYPGEKSQIPAYNDAIKICRKASKWLALIDSDEFLFPVECNSLPDILHEYEEFPAVGVNWVVYGPCNHQTRPEGPVIENYTLTFQDENNSMNLRIKSIVQPKQVLTADTAHNCIYKHKKFAVDENKNAIDGTAMYEGTGLAFTEFHHRKYIQINHYWTKSLEELAKKCQRGYPDGAPNPRPEQMLSRLNYPLIEDMTILKYLDTLKKNLG